jgi:tetratricopeptide (TPR) repeat protein
LFVGWLWYLGMMVPVIGLVQVGSQTMADRYTYLPQIGLCIALVWGVADLCRSWAYRRRVCGISSALVLVILLGCAWRQTSFWCDSETLWTHTLACTSQNYAAHNNLGNALANQRRFDEAMAQFQKALEVKPSDAETHNNLGVALAGRGQFDAALNHYRRALEINPNFAEARNNLGFILARLGRFQEATICYRQALTTGANFAEVRGNLGIALAALGQFDEAIVQYQQALEIKPRYAEVHNNLGLALQARGRMDEATTHFQQALAIKADFIQAHYNLGSAFATQGRFDEAMAHYRKALDFATQDNNQALADVVRARIAGYEADKAPHQPRPNSVRLPPKP